MDTDRKLVAICSEDRVFNAALRLFLSDYEARVSTNPHKIAEGSAAIVWLLGANVRFNEIVAVAGKAPTLIMAHEDQLFKAVDAGCRGFLPTSASLEEVRGAVATMISGGAVVPPHLLGTLLQHLVKRRRQDEAGSAAIGDLTKRERQVFELAASGLRKKEIAARLFISPATARTHLQRVYRKLGVHSQTELMALSLRITDPG